MNFRAATEAMDNGTIYTSICLFSFAGLRTMLVLLGMACAAEYDTDRKYFPLYFLLTSTIQFQFLYLIFRIVKVHGSR